MCEGDATRFTVCESQDKRLMSPHKEEEVKDEGMERGGDVRKDEGIPDAPLLRTSQDSERRVQMTSQVRGTQRSS